MEAREVRRAGRGRGGPAGGRGAEVRGSAVRPGPRGRGGLGVLGRAVGRLRPSGEGPQRRRSLQPGAQLRLRRAEIRRVEAGGGPRAGSLRRLPPRRQVGEAVPGAGPHGGVPPPRGPPRAQAEAGRGLARGRRAQAGGQGGDRAEVGRAGAGAGRGQAGGGRGGAPGAAYSPHRL